MLDILHDTIDMGNKKVKITIEMDLYEDKDGVYIIFNGEKKYILES